MGFFIDNSMGFDLFVAAWSLLFWGGFDIDSINFRNISNNRVLDQESYFMLIEKRYDFGN